MFLRHSCSLWFPPAIIYPVSLGKCILSSKLGCLNPLLPTSLAALAVAVLGPVAIRIGNEVAFPIKRERRGYRDLWITFSIQSLKENVMRISNFLHLLNKTQSSRTFPKEKLFFCLFFESHPEVG